MHDAAPDAFGTSRIVNAPGLSVTAAEMVATLERVAGSSVAQHVRWQRDARIERIVASWPGAWDTSRAIALGLPVDDSFETIVRRYIDEIRAG